MYIAVLCQCQAPNLRVFLKVRHFAAFEMQDCGSLPTCVTARTARIFISGHNGFAETFEKTATN
jgi:hypothetical protein